MSPRRDDDLKFLTVQAAQNRMGNEERAPTRIMEIIHEFRIEENTKKKQESSTAALSLLYGKVSQWVRKCQGRIVCLISFESSQRLLDLNIEAANWKTKNNTNL